MSIVTYADTQGPTPAQSLGLALHAALGRGWRVFPQKFDKGRKVPTIRDWPNRATTEKEALAEWWRENGTWIPGIATGRGSGCWVLDVDRKNDVDGLATLTALCETQGWIIDDVTLIDQLRSLAFIVDTPSGGQHWYFAYPDIDDTHLIRNQASSTLGAGLDVRGDGGQVVAPYVRLQYNGQWCTYQPVEGQEDMDHPRKLQRAPSWLESMVVADAATVHAESELSMDVSQLLPTQRDILRVYLQGQISVGVDQLTHAAPGTRNPTLNRVSYALGGWAHVGLERAEVFDKLMHACGVEGNNLISDDGYEQCVISFNSGWADGGTEPQTLPAYIQANMAMADPQAPALPPVDGASVTGADGGTFEIVRTAAPAREYVENLDTDQTNAEEFAARYRHEYAWSKETDWMIFDGRRWRRDTGETRILRCADIARALRLLAFKLDDENKDKNKYLSRARRLQSVGGVAATLRLAQPRVFRSITDYDCDPEILNCPNGTLELVTGEMRPHRAEDLLTQMTSAPYNPGAKDDIWDRVVWGAVSEDRQKIEALQRLMGYTLTGYVTAKLFVVVHGPTNTAKSTITEPFAVALGNIGEGGYATSWDADMIQANPKQHINKGEKLAKSRGARMVLVGELERGSRMAGAFVKRFTGGDMMDAKALYEGSYDYRPTASLWLATNYIPASPDPAVHKRMIMMPLTHVPPVLDQSIKHHLETDPGAQEAILAWAVRGAMAWLRDHSLGEMPWMADQIKTYAADSDPLITFIEECFTYMPGQPEAGIHPNDMWDVYRAWASLQGDKPMRKGALSSGLVDLGYTKAQYGKQRVWTWLGLAIKIQAELDPRLVAAVNLTVNLT